MEIEKMITGTDLCELKYSKVIKQGEFKYA
jgi:hypothetical protein